MEDAAGSASSANTVQEARSSVADLAERSYALRLDAEDSLRHLRAHFWLPQKSSLKKRIGECRGDGAFGWRSRAREGRNMSIWPDYGV